MEKVKALLGAGCFWGVEEVFRKVEGVLNTKVGYAGGHVVNPTYQNVCFDNTGHVEVVHIEYNSVEISFKKKERRRQPHYSLGLNITNE